MSGLHAAATAAAALILGLAGEDGRATVDGHGRDGAVAQSVVERVNLIGEALSDEGVLRRLRSGKLLHVELLAKLRNLVVLRVNLVLTQLVDDALGACGLAGDDVAHAIGEGRTVGAVLGKDGRGLVRGGKAVLAAAVGELRLQSVEALRDGSLEAETLLHVGNLSSVGIGLHASKALHHVGVDTVEAVAEGHLNVPAAVAKLRGKVLHALIDALNGGLEHLVAEPVIDVLLLSEPRVKLVAASEASTAVAVTTSISSVVSKPSEESEQH